MMSMYGVKPGEMGDNIILSRLEKGSAPVTVHIPTSKQQVRAVQLNTHHDSVNACCFCTMEILVIKAHPGHLLYLYVAAPH